MSPRSTRPVLVVLTTLALAACGGDDGRTAIDLPATSSCTQQTIFQGSLGTLGANTLLRAPFVVPSTGRLDVTLDWTFASTPVAVFVTPRDTCSLAALNARTCTFLIRSESGAKPRRVSAPNVTAGSYDLLIGNGGQVDESMTVTLVVSGPTCPALP